jgi:hypothetical protein
MLVRTETATKKEEFWHLLPDTQTTKKDENAKSRIHNPFFFSLERDTGQQLGGRKKQKKKRETVFVVCRCQRLFAPSIQQKREEDEGKAGGV